MKILKNVTVVNPCERELIEGVTIVVEEGIIKKITTENLKESGDVYDLEGKLVFPGLINAHTHLYSALARGMPIKGSPGNFVEILKGIWWKLDQVLDEQDIYWSAISGAMEAIKRGSTLIIDHHASPGFIVGSLDIIEDALKRVGLRAILSYEVTDRHGREGARKGIEENLRYAKKVKGDRLLGASFGLHASFTLSEETLREAVQAESEVNTGFHIHLAEDVADVEDSIKKYGTTPAERLHSIGILKDKTLAIHGVHLKENDMKVLKGSGSFLIVNPSSNMNNAVGLPPIMEMLSQNIVVGLGTDGLGQDMMNEMRNTMLAIKTREKDPSHGFSEAIKLLFCNNRKIASKLLPLKLGKVEEGYVADLTIFDYKSPTPLKEDNIWAHLLYGTSDFKVDSVMVNGEFILFKKNFTRIDEGEMLERAKEAAKRIWSKLYG